MNIWRLLLLPFLCCTLMVQMAKAQLSANFTATPTMGCAPIRVVFQDISTGSPTSWKWDLGNGTVTTQQSPSTTYFAPGMYTIKLVIYKGTDSNVIVKTNYINVFAIPVADFSATPLQGCFPLNVAFTDLSNAGSGNLVSWLWDFGDGNTSNLQNPNHTYLNAGIFNVTLTTKNSNGCSRTLNKLNLVHVSTGVIAGFTSSLPPTCTLPATITFTNTSTGAISSYLWNFGDGTSSTQVNPVHTYTTPGIYTVTLTVTSASGCVNTFTIANPVRAGVVNANFNAPSTICANTAFGLQNTSAPAGSLVSSTWYFSDGTTSTATNPVKSFSSPGTYTIKLVSDFGLCNDSIIKTIIVAPKPTAGFNGVNLGACLPPLTANFTDSSTGAISYSWNFGDGGTSTAANPSHTYTTGGNFTVTLIITNASGCRDTLRRPAYVIIAPPHITSITPLPAQGCVPFSTFFTPVITTSEAIVGYEWDFGDGTTSTLPNPSHTYSVEGAYIIKLKITSAGGCTDTISYRPGVVVGQKPHANFTATPLIACAMDLIHFTDLSTGPSPDHWFWTFGDGGTSNEQNPSYNYNDTGFFTVTLIVTHSGCKDTLRIPRYIYIKPPIASFLDSFTCANQKLHFFTDQSVGAITYAWTFGDGSTDTIHSPTHLYADTGRYNVRLHVSDGVCQHEANKMVYVLDEKAGFNTGDSLGCKSIVKEFTATIHAWNVKKYTWSFGDSTTVSDTTGPFIRHRYDSAGTYNVKLKITDLNNCPDSVTKPVVVKKYGPKANFGPFQKVCIRSLTTFADSSRSDSINAIVKWTWDFGDSTAIQTFTAPPFTHTYLAGGTYSIRLIVEDASGCRDTLYKINNVKVNDPKANFISTDTLICRGSNAVINDISLGIVTAWAWDLGDGTTATTPSVTHAYLSEGTYTIKLRITDDAGCKDSTTRPQYIRVFNAKAIFSLSDSFTSCPPLVVSFTNQSINGAQSFWDFGDGNTSSLANPSHTYTQSGIFMPKLIVTGNGGCKDTLAKTIKILGPTGTFTYTPILGCTPLQVKFNANAVNTFFYTFDFSDGTTQFSSNDTTTHPYVLLGNYLPKIILEDSLGCKLPIFGTDTIRVKGIRTYVKSLTTYLLCDSGIVHFQDSIITNDIVQSYLWNFGDGATSTLQAPSHSYAVSGWYIVTFKATTVTGCVSIDTLRIPIHVTPSPKVSITGSGPGCVPAIVQFGGQWLNPDTSVVTWRWNFGNGQTSTLQNPAPVNYPAAGNYTVRLIGRNASGCSDTFSQPLIVYPLPVINAGPDKFLCRGQSDTLRATGGTSYTWQQATSLSCTNCASPRAMPDSTHPYIVQGTDVHGCKNIDTVLVIVKQPFLMQVGPGDTLCVGQSFQLHGYGAENYLWQPSRWLNAATIPNPIARPDSTVTYRLIGYDSVGCFKDTGYVTIKVYPIPRVDILENQVTINVGDQIQLHSTASADVTRWRWTPALNLTCYDCPNPISAPRQNMTYVLTVTNPGNCTAQDQVTITLLCKEGNIFVPNTFSPNKDGANDVFYPRGKGLFSVKSMRIFDRWGELLYEKTNFLPNDPSAGWDGTHKGVELTPDVYVYLMEVICDNNVIYTLKGNVTLLR